MKKTLFILSALFLFTTMGFAQRGYNWQDRSWFDEQHKGEIFAFFKNFTQKQRSELNEIYRDYYAERTAIFKSRISRDKQLEKIIKLNKKRDKKINKVLTKTQRKDWEKRMDYILEKREYNKDRRNYNRYKNKKGNRGRWTILN